MSRKDARKARRRKKIEDRQKRKATRSESRSTRKATRQEGRQKRKQAKISKKNAEKLEKVYGDMTPEEIQAINEIQPYVPQMAKDMQEQGVELNDPTDPVEVGTRYAQIEGAVEDELSEAIDEGYIEEPDSWDDLDHQEKVEKRRGALRKIGGFIGQVLPLATQYFGKTPQGEQTGAGALAQGMERGVMQQRTGQFFTSPIFIVLVAAILGYVLFVKKP